MKWETVKISLNSRGKTTAYASIGFGRLSLNAGACQLIEDYGAYKYVEILKGRRDNKPIFGVRMLKEASDNCIKISRRVIRGKEIEYSGDIGNKPLMEELFGMQGVQNKATRYPVTLDEDDKTILIISCQ